MNVKGNPFHSVAYENNCSPDPVTANDIRVQAVNKNRTNTEPGSEPDDALRFFNGIVPNATSPYCEDGVLKQDSLPLTGGPGNWACKSSAPYIEDILADEQLRTRHTIGIDPYSPQPAYNPWYKPFAKRAQQRPTNAHERPNVMATYQVRSHNSWSRGECLGTFIAIVTFVFIIMALFVYIIMGVNGYLTGNRWNPWLG